MPSRLAWCGRMSRCESRCSRRYASATVVGGSARTRCRRDRFPPQPERQLVAAPSGQQRAVGLGQGAEAELTGRVPGVEHLPVGGDRGQAVAPGRDRSVCSRSHRLPAWQRCSPREVLADPVALTRALVDIESVSGNEKEIADAVEEALQRART